MNSFNVIFRKYWLILLLGLVLRLFLAATTFHLDVKAQMVASSAYFSGSLDPYRYARQIHPDTVLDKLPASYYLDLPIRVPFRPLIDTSKEAIFLLSPNKLFGDLWLNLYLAYAKLPYIIIDLLLSILLAVSVDSLRQRKVLIIWMFNPITLWATVMVGQIDVYIAFFILLSWYLIKQEKFAWASFVLGLGGAVKSAPFLLLPLLLYFAIGWKDKVKLILLSIVPYLVTVTPYLISEDFKRDALFAPQLEKMLYAKILLSGGESIYLSLVVVFAIYLHYFRKVPNPKRYLEYGLSIFLAILSLTHFHIQWLLWLTPFLILWLFDHWRLDLKIALGSIVIGLIMMLFLFESSLQLRLFAPIFPWLDQVSGLWEILSNEQVFQLRSFTASLFAAGSFYLVLNILKEGEK